MKLLVTGSRHYKNHRRVRAVLTAYQFLCKKLGEEFSVIVGDCPTGADMYVRNWCEQYDVPFKEYEAYWETMGKRAGPMRNKNMVNDGQPDDCVAFFQDGEDNKGTEQCADYAESKGVRVYALRD